jgi:hypothetical protein
VDVINQLTMGTKPMEGIINEWDLSVLQQGRGQQITVSLKGRCSVLTERGQHGMGITLGANIVLIAATILLDAIFVCQRVGANGSQTLKLARHGADVDGFHFFPCCKMIFKNGIAYPVKLDNSFNVKLGLLS